MVNISPAKILIVDDEESNVKLLKVMLAGEGYPTVIAYNGREGLERAVEDKPDLILLDVMMPDMDGFETVALLKRDPRTQSIPVIMVTALDDRQSKLRALEAGAEEFLSKPIDYADLCVRVRNLLRLKEYGDFLANHNRILQEQVRERTAELDEAYRDTVLTLVRAAEYKDPETGRHVRRIGLYCRELAKIMALPPTFQDAIHHASPMHDIGKIGIPDRILLKPGGFSDEEWVIMKSHCVIGRNILSNGESPYLRMGADIALNHHERWDGSGYPNARKGEDIPQCARIMQICDVYDALRSKRPYKEALSHLQTVAIIIQGDGRTQPEHFDPQVLSAFLANTERFATIFAQHA